jgi:signal transduction histidine kinase
MEQIHHQKGPKNSGENQITNKKLPNKSLKAYISFFNRKMKEPDSESKAYRDSLNLNDQNLNKCLALQNAILEALPGAKFLLNVEGEFLHCFQDNELKGFLSEICDLPGRKLADVFPPHISMAVQANINKSVKTQSVQKFEFVLPKDELLYFYETRINRISDREVIAIFKDVTHLKKAEEALKRQMNELDEKNRQLEKYIDSNLQLENFAYIASHDLREPLRTIRNFAGLLKSRYSDQLDEIAINHINLIVNGATQMNALVEDLLTYSRVNTENHSIEPINTELLINEVLNGLESYVNETGAEVIIHELPPLFHANPTKMQQLFLNLITNAIKFRKPDITPKVNLSMKDYGDFWKISVQDNGIGIRKEFQKQIFVLFKKLHSSKEHPGTGLGLAICQKIIEQHEGNIWVESALGEGATFTCTIKKNLQKQEG